MSQKIFLAIVGTIALIGAVQCALAIWRPKYRGYWGGPFTGHTSPNDPDKMQLGAVSHLGFGLACTGFSVCSFMSLFSDPVPPSAPMGFLPILCFAFILTGFCLVAIGWRLDSRAHKSKR